MQVSIRISSSFVSPSYLVLSMINPALIIKVRINQLIKSKIIKCSTMTYKNPIIQYGYGFASFLEIYTQKRDRRNCPLAFPSKKNEKEEKILLWFSSKIKKIKNEILTVILACIMCFLSFISINLQVNSSTLADTICNLKKQT